MQKSDWLIELANMKNSSSVVSKRDLRFMKNIAKKSKDFSILQCSTVQFFVAKVNFHVEHISYENLWKSWKYSLLLNKLYVKQFQKIRIFINVTGAHSSLAICLIAWDFGENI